MPISPFLILDDERKKRQEELRDRYDRQAQQFGQAVLSVPQLQKEYEDRTRKLSQEMEDRAFLAKERKAKELEFGAAEASAVAEAARARGPGPDTVEMKEDKGFFPQPEEAYTETPAGYYPQPEGRYEKPAVPQKVEFEGPQPVTDMGPLPQPKPEERLAPPPPPGRMVVTPADNSDAAFVTRAKEDFKRANPGMPDYLAESAAYEILQKEKAAERTRGGSETARLRAIRDAIEAHVWAGRAEGKSFEEILEGVRQDPLLASLPEQHLRGVMEKVGVTEGRKDAKEEREDIALGLRKKAIEQGWSRLDQGERKLLLDASKEEYDRYLGIKPSDKVVERLTQIDTSLEALKDINDMTTAENTGPIQGRVDDFRAAWGFHNKDNLKRDQALLALVNKSLHDLGGAQMPEAEFQRLVKGMATKNTSEEAFRLMLDGMKKQLNRERDTIISGQKKVRGVHIEGFEGGSEPAPEAPRVPNVAKKSSTKAAEPAKAEKIRVRRKVDGKTGTIDASDFNPDKYERI